MIPWLGGEREGGRVRGGYWWDTDVKAAWSLQQRHDFVAHLTISNWNVMAILKILKHILFYTHIIPVIIFSNPYNICVIMWTESHINYEKQLFYLHYCANRIIFKTFRIEYIRQYLLHHQGDISVPLEGKWANVWHNYLPLTKRGGGISHTFLTWDFKSRITQIHVSGEVGILLLRI